MIKGRLPFPFETIGLAVAFTSGLSTLVRETKRLCTLHGSTAVFMHVGKKTSEKQRELNNVLTANGFNDNNSRIYWDPGETIITLLRICKHEVVDLLLIGASERDSFHLPIGATARTIALKAKCSVLILTGGQLGPFRKLVVNGSGHRKTELTIQTAIHFGEYEKSDTIKIIDEAEIEMEDEDDIVQTKSINSILEKSAVAVEHHSLSPENNSITNFAFQNNADLLVTNSSDHHLLIFDRISLMNGLDTMLKNMPCSMLIVHSRM
jgi:nucleotide-binding universal stress UspA family protein